MIYRLVILNGDRRGERITVTPEPMSVGRDPSCDICFTDPEVALSHAEVSHAQEGLAIRDRGSMNRLLVNNREVREAHLKHGDVVEVGHTRFLVQAYVQAEVEGDAAESHRRRNWVVIGSVTVLAIGLLVGLHGWSAKPVAAPRAPSPRPSRPVAAKVAPRVVNTRTNASQAVAVHFPAIGGTGAVERGDDSLLERAPVASRAPESAAAKAASEVEEVRAVMAASNAVPVELDAVAIARKELEEAANALLDSKVRDMLEEARGVATNEGPAAAERLLTAIEKVKPDFLEAAAERAAMLEEQGKLEPALVLWADIRTRGRGTPLADAAETKLKEIVPAKEKLVFPFTGRLRIASADIAKFPETDAFREMRLLTIRLVATELQKEVDVAAVRVEVRFYDWNRQTGKIGLTTARVPTNAVTFAAPWRATEEKAAEVSYLVPADGAATERPEEYYGFAARVYYYGALQNEWVQPKDLPADVTLALPEIAPATNGPIPEAVAAPAR